MDRKQLDKLPFAKSIRAVSKSPAKHRVAMKGYIIKVRIFHDNPWTAESEFCAKTKDEIIRSWFGINLGNVLLTILSLLVIPFLIEPHQRYSRVTHSFLRKKTSKSNQVIYRQGQEQLHNSNIHAKFPPHFETLRLFQFSTIVEPWEGGWAKIYFVHQVKLIDLKIAPVTYEMAEIHNSDVITGAMASQLTSLTIVYSAVYSGADQRKHQSSASLAFVREIHRWPVNSPHKWSVTRKMFPFDDVIITSITSNTWFTIIGWGYKNSP